MVAKIPIVVEEYALRVYRVVIFVKFDFVVLVDYGMSHLQARNGKYKWKTDVIIFFYVLKLSHLIHIQYEILLHFPFH